MNTKATWQKLRERIKIKFNGFSGPLPNPDKWLFIVGCYNSGTTLLHDMLGKHSEIGSMSNEGQYKTDQFLLPEKQGLPRLWAYRPEKFYLSENKLFGASPKKLKRQWGASFNDHTKKVLMEKSPTNAGRILWLNRNFENAYFIAIIRNGYAVAEGIRRKVGHDISKTALQWKNSNEIMLRDLQKVNNKMIIQYEYFTQSPNKCYSQILDFLKLPEVPINLKDLKFDIHERNSHIKNMNETSFSNLSETDCQVIQSICGNLLREFGYNNDNV